MIFPMDSSKPPFSEPKKTCWTKLKHLFGTGSDKGKAPQTQHQKATKVTFRNIKYKGRQPLAVTATGGKVQHKREFKKLIMDTMGDLSDEELKKMEISVVAQVKAVYPEQRWPYDADAEYEKVVKKPDPYFDKPTVTKPNEQAKDQAKDLPTKKPDDKPKNK